MRFPSRMFWLFLFLPLQALAGDPELIPKSGLLTPSGAAWTCNFKTGDLHFSCIPLYLAYLIEFVFGFVGFICIIQVMFAGYQIASANLLGQDRSAGTQRLTWSLVGLAISVLSFVIVDFFVTGIAT